MAFSCISIGSNLDDPSHQVSEAIRLLEDLPSSSIDKRSSLYETSPWGIENQPNFINAVVGLTTDLNPHNLLSELQKIESTQGRIRHKKWAARIIDLDILCYDQIAISDDQLTLPHPFFSERSFVLEPLVEIYPNLIISGKTSFEWLKIFQRDKSF